MAVCAGACAEATGAALAGQVVPAVAGVTSVGESDSDTAAGMTGGRRVGKFQVASVIGMTLYAAVGGKSKVEFVLTMAA